VRAAVKAAVRAAVRAAVKAAVKLGFECARTHWNQGFIPRAAVREIMLRWLTR
jgi:hypothetical protein